MLSERPLEIHQHDPFLLLHGINSTCHSYQVFLYPSWANSSYATWSIVGFIFNFHIKRRYPAWWGKYNYVTSAALDCGLAVSLIVIFLVLSLPKAGIKFEWWGNSDAFNTAVRFSIAALTVKDFHGTPIVQASKDHTFGPQTW